MFSPLRMGCLVRVDFFVDLIVTWVGVFLMSIRFGNGAVFSDVVDQIVCPTVIFAYDCLMLPSGLNIMLFASLGVGFAQVPIQFGVI